MELLGYIILSLIVLYIISGLIFQFLKENWQKRVLFLVRLLFAILIFIINFTGFPENYIKKKVITLVVMLPVIIAVALQSFKNLEKYNEKSYELLSWSFWTEIIIFLVQ